jgi:hypothetical protein
MSKDQDKKNTEPMQPPAVVTDKQSIKSTELTEAELETVAAGAKNRRVEIEVVAKRNR